MTLLYQAWRHGGEDPYCLFNGLTRDYRPVERPLEEPIPPPEPRRIRNVIYAFASAASREQFELSAMSAGMGGA